MLATIFHKRTYDFYETKVGILLDKHHQFPYQNFETKPNV